VSHRLAEPQRPTLPASAERHRRNQLNVDHEEGVDARDL
jgi:hypothetical protein